MLGIVHACTIITTSITRYSYIAQHTRPYTELISARYFEGDQRYNDGLLGYIISVDIYMYYQWLYSYPVYIVQKSTLTMVVGKITDKVLP